MSASPAGLPPDDPAADAAIGGRMVRVAAAMGVSSGAVLVFAALRSKIVAVQLGPEGVGNLSLLLALLGVASVAFELGIAKSAVRHLAAARDDTDGEDADAVRRALRLLGPALAATGGLVVVALAAPIAEGVLQDASLTSEVRFCAVAVAAAILGEFAVSELNGLRRLRALAVLPATMGAAATAAAALAAVTGADLVVVVLLAPPVTLAAGALFLVRRLPSPGTPARAAVSAQARRMAVLGAAIVANTTVVALAALLVRVIIDSDLARAQTGEYQAALAIVTLALGFAFATLLADYLPLTSSLARTPARLNSAVNAQLRVIAQIAAPLVMGAIVAAPLVVTVFYTSEFDATPGLLRVMLPGELLRCVAWTIAVVLIAREARALVVVSALLYAGVLVGLTAMLVGVSGLDGAAVAFTVSHALSAGWALLFAWRLTGFRLSGETLRTLGLLGAAVTVVALTSGRGAAGLVAAVIVTLAATWWAGRGLLRSHRHASPLDERSA